MAQLLLKIVFKLMIIYRQRDSADCGPTCLRMIAAHYGKQYSLSFLCNRCQISREGASMYGMSVAAESIGLRPVVARLHLSFWKPESPLPAILYWDKNHFIVLYKVSYSKISRKKKFHIVDPAYGKIILSEKDFLNKWSILTEDERGYALFLEPSNLFYEGSEDFAHAEIKNKGFIRFFIPYLHKYRRHIALIILAMVTGNLLLLIAPFITQTLIDKGVQKNDFDYISLLLLFQGILFVAGIFGEVIRNYLLRHISARINIAVLSDFLFKLMKLPLSFFESRMKGDLIQRIYDFSKLERIFTYSGLNFLISSTYILFFSIILIYYNLIVFLIFIFATIITIVMTFGFLHYLMSVYYRRISLVSANNSQILEIIEGVQEIKMNNLASSKLFEWEMLQSKLFKVNLTALSIEQTWAVCTGLLEQAKNISITFVAAWFVIKGEMTIGTMLAISFIVGQLNNPVRVVIEFFREMVDVRLSYERINEVHDSSDEESAHTSSQLIASELKDGGIQLHNVSFCYNGSEKLVLKNISFSIPKGKVTAIVGASGSGKTTLLKLLLKFYDPTEGEISLDGNSLLHASPQSWRDQCGAVLQEGYIFTDTIKGNITAGNDVVDNDALRRVAQMANIDDFIKDLPLGYETKIGNGGISISTGQKQRILIARALYKNPQFLFLDEATSSLDARNEKEIIVRLNEIFKGKTVVVIAHRLSTVKNADQIVVLDKGIVCELGTHVQLINMKGQYYSLVKNQLELGL